MADYYSLLSRAVSNLPKSSPPSARRAIYDRARKALIGQLRSLKPALPESDIAREENALDAAVTRLESELGPSPAAPPPMPTSPPARPVVPPRPAAPPPPPRPAVSLQKLAPPLKTPVAPLPAAGSVGGGAALGSAAGNAPTAPIALVPPRPVPPMPSPVEGLIASFAAGASGSKTVPEANAAAPLVSAAAAEAAGPDHAPRIGSPLEAATPGAEADPPRPGAPGRAGPAQGNPWPWIALAVVVGLVGSIAVFAFLTRQGPQDLTIKEPAEPPPTITPAPNGQKIAERVGGAPATAETPAPPPPAQPPTTTASAVPAPAPNSIGAPAPTASSAPPPVAALLPVTARAAMLVATAADAQKPAVAIGTVVWSAVPALPGQPGSVGVKADIDIPDLKMHASMTLRKNTDAALPASHTIDLRLIFDDGSPIKGVKDIDLPRMRRDDSPNTDPLLGVKVKINDTYFLIGLNRADADVAHNVEEIATRGWFDFPLLLNDDRIAKLTFEKAADGERVVNDAMMAWK